MQLTTAVPNISVTKVKKVALLHILILITLFIITLLLLCIIIDNQKKLKLLESKIENIISNKI